MYLHVYLNARAIRRGNFPHLMEPSDQESLYSTFDIDFDFLTGAGRLFRVLGFGYGVSGFGFWVSGLGFRVSGSRFKISGPGFRVSGFGFRGFDERRMEGEAVGEIDNSFP